MSHKLKEKNMEVELKMKMTIDEKDYKEIKELEYHIEYMIDYIEWPEIKRVYDVTVQPLAE